MRRLPAASLTSLRMRRYLPPQPSAAALHRTASAPAAAVCLGAALRHCASSSHSYANSTSEQDDGKRHQHGPAENEHTAAREGEEKEAPPPPASKFVETAAAVRPPPPLPHFDTSFEVGTGRFTLIGRGPCEGVFVSCVVSAHHKPRLLQLGGGNREAGGGDEEEGGQSWDGTERARRANNSAAAAEDSAFIAEAAAGQKAYHRHLWTCARQRLNVSRRKQQRRRDAAAAAGLLANRAATLEAFLQHQHNQNYSTGGGSSSSSLKAMMDRHAAANKGRIGRMTLMCPPRPSDVVPPAPQEAAPPPPLQRHQRHRGRLLEDAAAGVDNNPHRALAADPFEEERDRHRRQYLALDAIVAEDGGEQLPVRFRVGLLARKAAAASSSEVGATKADGIVGEKEKEEADVIADFMGGASEQQQQQQQQPNNNSNSGSAVKFTNRMLHLSCSTIAPAAALSVDGANFFADPTVFLETSLHSTDRALRGYLGPQLHQRHLANYACGREGQLNKYLFPTLSGHVDGTSGATFFRPDVSPEVSIADRGAHLPVHTVPPRLHDALRGAVAARGVDDELALYVHRYAQYVFAHERLVWRQRLVSFVKRGRLHPQQYQRPSEVDPPQWAEGGASSAETAEAQQ